LEKDGTIKVWEILTTDCHDGTSVLTVMHGQEGGKMQDKHTVIAEGKQKRTVSEQAVNEANGKIKKQIDKGYRYSKEELGDLPLLAMLAGDYHKIGHRINWEEGVDLSDKLDGVRCVAKCKSIGVVELESRTGQEYYLPHVSNELARYMNAGEVLDGEIYLHGYALQEITSAVKRTDTQKEIDICQRKLDKALGTGCSMSIAEASAELEAAELIHKLRPKLEFIAFDIPSERPWQFRLADLLDFEAERMEGAGFVKVLKYTLVFSEAEMNVAHKDAVARAFEGIMMRNRMGMYESGKRSADLQKYKEFMDAEFYILDVIPDKDGLGVFVVKNIYADNTFTVIMGSHAERAYQLKNKHEFKGLPLTVKFQTLYKGTLIPQFPVGVAIRDYE
jgi:DNA ligase-1